MTRKVAEMRTTLAQKGFRLENTHHAQYRLYVDGRKTAISTRFSHSKKEYDDRLLGFMRRQMKLQNALEFNQFMDCEMTGDAYAKNMVARGEVRQAPPPEAPSATKKKKGKHG